MALPTWPSRLERDTREAPVVVEFRRREKPLWVKLIAVVFAVLVLFALWWIGIPTASDAK